MKTLLLAICQSALIDRQTNSLSLIEVHEEITANGFPTMVPQISVVWVTRRELTEPAESTAELRVAMNNEELARFPIRLKFMESRHSRSVIALQAVVLTTPGDLRFEIIREGTVEASQSVVVFPPAAGPVVVGTAG